jgi:hypothetical protein
MNKDQLVVLEEHLKKEIRATRDDMRQIEREQANRQE